VRVIVAIVLLLLPTAVVAQTGKRIALLIGKRALSYFLSTEITQVAQRFVRCRPMSMQSSRRCELC
jgi:hypothetical protein